MSSLTRNLYSPNQCPASPEFKDCSVEVVSPDGRDLALVTLSPSWPRPESVRELLECVDTAVKVDSTIGSELLKYPTLKEIWKCQERAASTSGNRSLISRLLASKPKQEEQLTLLVTGVLEAAGHMAESSRVSVEEVPTLSDDALTGYFQRYDEAAAAATTDCNVPIHVERSIGPMRFRVRLVESGSSSGDSDNDELNSTLGLREVAAVLGGPLRLLPIGLVQKHLKDLREGLGSSITSAFEDDKLLEG